MSPAPKQKSPPHTILPSRRTRRANDIRERLFRAALRLFAERGYFATTVEDITEAADLGKGTFFNYFPSKEHVLSTFGDQRLAFFERALDQVRGGKSTVAEALAETIARITTVSADAAGLFRSIFAAHACSDSVRTHYRERICRCQQIIATILNIGQTRGEVRRDRNSAEMARIMQQTFVGLTMAWAMNPEEPLAGLSRDVWSALWESFRARKIEGRARGRKMDGIFDIGQREGH
jgi:AcrR family transcriptional regulator